MKNIRTRILEENRKMREGQITVQGPRRLDDGEVGFRIPEEDYPVLMMLFPELASKDPTVRHMAWEAFRETPLGEQYLVQRPPRIVRRAPLGVIVR